MAHNKLFHTQRQQEDRIIRFSIISFWSLYWLLNIVNAFIGDTVLPWVGGDPFLQFADYFTSIGVQNEMVAQNALVLTTVLEGLAFIFAAFALKFFIEGDRRQARGAMFWSVVMGFVIFTFFAVGDQVFGDRVELLEHTTYWIALAFSWYLYTRTEE